MRRVSAEEKRITSKVNRTFKPVILYPWKPRKECDCEDCENYNKSLFFEFSKAQWKRK